jgi:glutaminyl-peptide cyclotransferase
LLPSNSIEQSRTEIAPDPCDILTFMRRALLLTLTLLFTLPFARAQTPPTPVYTYKVIATFPHSTSSYTEGLFYLNGLFYESTGLKGHSQILVYDPTGNVKQHIDLAPQYFGEGIVDWGPNLYQWTWQSNLGFVYNRATLHPLAQFTYTGEGWGMTHDRTHLITSDGTATLRFRDPKDFHEVRNITVTDQGSPVTLLNELEYIHNEIYANVWHTNRIVRIDPRTGHVIAWIDLTGLLSPMLHLDNEAVLNGIAYDPQRDRLFVTGKEWPTIFQIKLIAPPPTRH